MTGETWQADFAQAQAARKANVVCMKWGTLYGPEWVNRLYAMVTRNTTWAIRFVCFTDDPTGLRPEVEWRPLPAVPLDPALGKRWPKLGLFNTPLDDLEGMTLYLDVDLVILNSIDSFFEHPGRFITIREWHDGHLGYGNTSVLRFFAGRVPEILQRFATKPHRHWYELAGSKEQNFVSQSAYDLSFWPSDWCVAFSKDCLPENRLVRFFTRPKEPARGKILVFYGSVTPQTAIHGHYERTKRSRPRLLNIEVPVARRFKPATWIESYWRE